MSGSAANVISLTGANVRRLDGEEPDQSLDLALFQKSADVPKEGVPIQAAGHCKAVQPFINEKNVLLTAIDTSFDYLFKGVGKVDEFVFADGVDRLTGVGEIQEPYQTYARWGERAVAAGGLSGAYYLAKTKSLKLAAQNTGTFWGRNWPLGTALFLAATELPSHAAKGLDLIDPEQRIFRNETRDWARLGTYGVMFAGAALLLNFPASHSYRQVNAPKPIPTNAKPMSAAVGLGFAAFYFAYDFYWSNASAQERILTSPLYDMEPGTGLYQPWNWKPEFLQTHTSAAHSITWGAFGAVWGALLGWQTAGTDRIMRPVFGFGSEVLPIKTGSPEEAFIGRGATRVTRGLRAVGARLFTPKRFLFTAASTAVGLPVGIGIGRAMEHAQGYGSKEAVSGTPFRAVITSPLSTAGTTYFAAAHGMSHAWKGYLFNMVPVNYTWAACSKMGENVYQVARGLADDYKASDDPNVRRELRTLLANLHRISYDNGKEDLAENEKLKIESLLAGVGINVRAIEEAAIGYATPIPPELEP